MNQIVKNNFRVHIFISCTCMNKLSAELMQQGARVIITCPNLWCISHGFCGNRFVTSKRPVTAFPQQKDAVFRRDVFIQSSSEYSEASVAAFLTNFCLACHLLAPRKTEPDLWPLHSHPHAVTTHRNSVERLLPRCESAGKFGRRKTLITQWTRLSFCQRKRHSLRFLEKKEKTGYLAKN